MLKEEKTFYYIEMSADLVDISSSGLEQQARVRTGDLTVISALVKEAYKDRVGEDMSRDLEELVNSKIADLMLLGWGRNLKERINPCGVDVLADTMFDAVKVFNRQRNYDKGYSKELNVPEQWNKDIDLPRFKKRFVSRSARDKQLRVFTK